LILCPKALKYLIFSLFEQEIIAGHNLGVKQLGAQWKGGQQQLFSEKQLGLRTRLNIRRLNVAA